MDPEDIKAALGKAGIKHTDTREIKDGIQLRFSGGEIVNLYESGKILPQGKNTQIVAELLSLKESARGKRKDEAAEAPPKKVFVAYGHDEKANAQAEALIRKWGLDPIFLNQLPSEGQTLIEKLWKYIMDEDVRFGIVMATPDDEGNPAGEPDEKKSRARQNVVLELGLLLGQLGRQRVAILHRRAGDFEKPSDIEGLIYLGFADNVTEVALDLLRELRTQGFDIDLGKL